MICQVTTLGYSSLSANQMNIPGGTCQGLNAIWNNIYGLSQFDYCMNWFQNEIPLDPGTGETKIIPFAVWSICSSPISTPTSIALTWIWRQLLSRLPL